ncbi:MAG TPA: DUF3108 domain-containing protein [Xanthobacteraceae bacterium]|nr:DUF3108 domain-containing protein [Xanthobacteraceae bacterium]
MSSYHVTRHAIFVSMAALALTMAEAPQRVAFAQGKLDARYVVTLSGLPIGRGAWVIDIGEDYFTAAASGATAGLLRVFANGEGESSARGTISGGQLVPSTYASRIVTGDKSDEVRMAFSAGTVKELTVNPPTVPGPDRVPLTEAHRRGVSDPMSASLMRVPGSGDTLVPQACQRTLSIFDGRTRYDLQLVFKRLDRISSERGYQGLAVVCAVYFSPIAGHVPERYAIKYLMQLRDIEFWLAPIAGTRVMVPIRAAVPTPIGLGVLQATQFISVAQPSKAKTQ